ncbi:MAG: hypothetical protein KIT72_07280 [Polyangiaceae bacterium]|nr:hypothetical protein [Polyangiaceae bacterium]MCW5790205.1 hypothetical protein [Polyangiaceae bacterium]
MSKLRGRVMEAFRTCLQGHYEDAFGAPLEQSVWELVLPRLPRGSRAIVSHAEIPAWVDAQAVEDVIDAVAAVAGVPLARELGARVVETLFAPTEDPAPEQAMEHTISALIELTQGYEFHFERLEHVSGRLHLKTPCVTQSDISSDAWTGAIEALLRQHSQSAWSLMEDVFVDDHGSTATFLCQWDAQVASTRGANLERQAG